MSVDSTASQREKLQARRRELAARKAAHAARSPPSQAVPPQVASTASAAALLPDELSPNPDRPLQRSMSACKADFAKGAVAGDERATLPLPLLIIRSPCAAPLPPPPPQTETAHSLSAVHATTACAGARS